MKIGELAKKSGLSIDTLRYYERIGLIKAPLRDNAGHRVYPPDALAWIEFLLRLKSTGMSISKMVHYADLREMGEETRHERAQILEAHRQKVADEISQLNAHMKILNQKIDHYYQEDAICPADERVKRLKEIKHAG